MNKKRKTRICINITEEIEQNLRSLAENNDMNVSQVSRKILGRGTEYYMNQLGL